MDRGARWAAVHGITKSQTGLSNCWPWPLVGGFVLDIILTAIIKPVSIFLLKSNHYSLNTCSMTGTVKSEHANVLSHFSHVQLFCDPMDCQAPLSMGFFRQEYWNGCHALLQGIFLTQGSSWPRDLPDPGIEPRDLISTALADGFFTASATWEAPSPHTNLMI